MNHTQFFIGTQPWEYVDGEGYDYFLPRDEAELIERCLNCTVPAQYCHEHDDCYFVQQRRARERRSWKAQDLRKKWERELDEAVARIQAERAAANHD